MEAVRRHLYKGRVGINVLANSISNAKEVYEAAEGYAFIGLLSKNYATAEEAVIDMKAYGAQVNHAISIGLGGGDNRQAAVVAEIVKMYAGVHINQVFPMVGMTRANTRGKDCWINSLVSPTGRAGFVNISTGQASSSQEDKAVVPVKAAISLIKDMGGNALKYFPMNGLACEDEYKAVAQACGEEQFALEPTGGIDKDNFEEILKIALEANVPRVIPHVYSSIIDQKSGMTSSTDIRYLLQVVKRLVDAYE